VLRITTKGKNIRRGKVADANAEHLSEAPTSSMLVNREAANQSHRHEVAWEASTEDRGGFSRAKESHAERIVSEHLRVTRLSLSRQDECPAHACPVVADGVTGEVVIERVLTAPKARGGIGLGDRANVERQISQH
jgi:hypothetical protein